MAKFIPNSNIASIENQAERQVYEALANLSDDYLIFYSLEWSRRMNLKMKTFGEIDFLVIHPKKGIIVIEVKGGELFVQDGRWYYQSGLETNDPLAQARESMYKVNEVLKENRVRDYMVFSAVWFPNLKSESVSKPLPLNYQQEQILTKESLLDPEKYLSAIYRQKSNHIEISNDIIKGILSPKFNLVMSVSNLIEYHDSVFHELTNEQARLLDYLEEQERAVVHGGAGTGKTLIAVEQAKRVASESNKVLLLCFNTFLREELRKRIDCEFISVENVHSLAATMLGTHNVNDTDLVYALEGYSSNDFMYDSVIIDEAQDFENDVIINLDRITKRHFYCFYDKHQLIQKNLIPDWVLKAECRLVLSKNCRNTVSIANTSMIPVQAKTKLFEKSIEGVKPFIKLGEVEIVLNEVYMLLERLIKIGINGKDIVLVTVKTEEKSIIQKSTSILNYCDQKGIKFTTARKFKGLESNVIIMVDMDHSFFETDNSRNIFYVATSRAKQYLFLFFSGEDSDGFYFANCLNQLSKARSGLYSIAKAIDGQIYDYEKIDDRLR